MSSVSLVGTIIPNANVNLINKSIPIVIPGVNSDYVAVVDNSTSILFQKNTNVNTYSHIETPSYTIQDLVKG